ncbi:MAG: hypothetical protein AABW67_03555 [Nanoarchaeota archaeon]
MNDLLYLLFNETKKSCLHCAYVKTFNPDASQSYKNHVIRDLKHISKWEIPKGLNILQTNLVNNCRTFAREALTKCGSECLNGVPEVAKYLEEKISASDAPEVPNVSIAN